VRVILVAAVVLATLGAGAVYLAWRFVDFGPEASGFDRGAVTFEVTNGCGVPRIARAVADELSHRGFGVYEVGNDSAWEHTAVIDLRDPEGARAEAVAAELSVARRFWFLRLRERLSPEWLVGLDSSRHVDLRLVVGSDYRRFFPDVVALR